MSTSVTGFMGRKFLDGEVIYHQGEHGECMYVVQEGKVELVHRDADREYCLSVLTRGSIFGENTLFRSRGKRRVTARAQGDVYVLTLEKDMLLRRLHEDPSLAFTLLESMSVRIRDLESQLLRVCGGSWSPPGDEGPSGTGDT